MADKTVLDSFPSQISKDVQGFGNAVPLSPQWLHPKQGENKTGIITREDHFSPYLTSAKHSDIVRSLGTGEGMPDMQKKKDIFRPSILAKESVCCDHWHDEERETNSSVRRDHWREGDRELGDNCKLDRWMESSGKQTGEGCHTPSEPWTDLSNRETFFDQRRESKWNTRWGPDDKGTDNFREKWMDSSKDADITYDKGLPHLIQHGKDEGDNYRPWKSGASYSRGRVEPPFHQTPTSNKQVHTFAHGRGRGENVLPTFSLGRGRTSIGGSFVNSIAIHTQSLHSLSEKGESGHGDSLSLRYSRTKLLDVYRVTDIMSCKKLLNGVAQVPSITQEESLEPLAFCAPRPDELVILKGIDKGDILNSGAPQITKNGFVGQNSSDFMQSRQTRLGSGESLQPCADDRKDESVTNSNSGYSNYSGDLCTEEQVDYYGFTTKIEIKQGHQPISDDNLSSQALREDNASYRRNDGVHVNWETSMQRNVSAHPGGKWRSPSILACTHSTSHEWKDAPDVRSRNPDIGWSQLQNGLNHELENGLADPFLSEGEPNKISDDPVFKQQLCFSMDKDQEMRQPIQQSPETLLLHYKDPQGEIQGPFAGSEIIGWFEVGYFGIDLQVRQASAPQDSPFLLLGDVMPHLRAKARPPPGFGASKQSEILDASSRPNLSSFSKLNAGSSAINIVRDEPLIESLMSGNMSSCPLEKFSPSEGMQGYYGNNSGAMLSLGADGGDHLHLLAKQRTLEKQRSLPNPYTYWPGRDVASIISRSDNVHDSSMQHSTLLPSIDDNPLQRQPPQNVDLLSILHDLPDRSASGVNNGVSGWSNFQAHGGLDPLNDKLDVHHTQNFLHRAAAVGIQQQRLQTQNQPSLTNILYQAFDKSSGTFAREKLLSSGHSEDPRLLSLLQQQYLLQLHSQAPVPSQQLSLLEKLLLLKQQQKQKQEEQQPQLHSKVMPEHHSLHGLVEPSHAQFQDAGLPAGNASMGYPEVQQLHELFQVGSQRKVPDLLDECVTNLANLPPNISQDVSHNIASEASFMHQPHQMSGDSINQKGLAATLPEHINDVQPKSSLIASHIMDNLSLAEVVDKHLQEQASQSNLRTDQTVTDEASGTSENFTPIEFQGKPVTLAIEETENEDLMMPQQIKYLKNPTSDGVGELRVERGECKNETSAVEEVKNVERGECKNETSVVEEVKNVGAREVKKASEKKSKKQKSSKTKSSEQKRGASRMKQSKQSDIEGANIADTKPEMHVIPSEVLHDASLQGESKSDTVRNVIVDLQQDNNVDAKNELQQVSSVMRLNAQVHLGQRTWKTAPGFKPNSLLEIQEEEQRRAQAEMAISEVNNSLSSMNFSSPWAGVGPNSDHKSFKEREQGTSNTESNMGTPDSSLNQRSTKSHLYDVLAEEALGNSTVREIEVSEGLSNLASTPLASSQSNVADDDNFVEAKDTKKSRKKSSKAKGAGAKASVPVASADVSTGLSPVDNSKLSWQVQQEKEAVPAVPSSPSLGDFVVWKEDSANASPASAWSTELKLPKPASFRDILKEQERRISSVQNQLPVPSPQKSVSTQLSRGTGPSRSFSLVSSAKGMPPVQINSRISSLSTHEGDDDLFWGPLDQSKKEAKQSDFPHAASRQSCGTKNNTPVKGTAGGSLCQWKSMNGRSTSLSSSTASVQTSLKQINDSPTKHSEAIAFRDWCESECLRLVGTKDTSFLEFCSKQSTSEAEMLLTENLGSFDPGHEFIDKFLNYRDFLPLDVLEIAFQSQNDRKVTELCSRDMTSDNIGVRDSDKDNVMIPDGSVKGGKKKGKKGKKVRPSALGFTVVSSRIMMGEIQTVED